MDLCGRLERNFVVVLKFFLVFLKIYHLLGIRDLFLGMS